MGKITITLDTSYLAMAAAGIAAMAMLAQAQRCKKTMIWWIKEHKRYALAAHKASDLIVITDFDATLTAGDSDQCHDMLGHTPLLSSAFREEYAPLLDWTTNAAIDGVEWWDRAHSVMLKHGMPPRPLIPRLVREAQMVPRPGALELLKKLEQLRVPVLIVSAGVSDIIEEFLRQHGALSENVTICSNRLNYEADSAPKSVSPDPPITSFTKAEAYKSASSFFAAHEDRRAFIVLGDSVSDVDPLKHVPFTASLSVGFVNSRPDQAAHAQAFDAVVQGSQGSLWPVMEIIDEMTPSQQQTLVRRVTSNNLFNTSPSPARANLHK